MNRAQAIQSVLVEDQQRRNVHLSLSKKKLKWMLNSQKTTDTH